MSILHRHHDPFDDIDEAVQAAALSAYEEMRAKGYSDEEAWRLADTIIFGVLAKLEEAADG